MSPRLRAACKWICLCLLERPASVYKTIDETRVKVTTWSDASGVDRWLAVVLCLEDRFFWTRCQIQQALIDVFIPREDNHIGILELLAPILAWATFRVELQGRLWTAFIDNQGVVHNLLRSTAASENASYLTGRFWLELATSETALYVQRVESKANVADDPTRNSTIFLQKLGAQWREPMLPGWVQEIWK